MSITATNASLTTDVIPPFSLDDSTLANDHFLIYNSTTQKFENKALTVGGNVVITGGTNLGTGSGVFESTSTHNMQFKSIIGGAGITLFVFTFILNNISYWIRKKFREEYE